MIFDGFEITSDDRKYILGTKRKNVCYHIYRFVFWLMYKTLEGFYRQAGLGNYTPLTAEVGLGQLNC